MALEVRNSNSDVIVAPARRPQPLHRDAAIARALDHPLYDGVTLAAAEGLDAVPVADDVRLARRFAGTGEASRTVPLAAWIAR